MRNDRALQTLGMIYLNPETHNQGSWCNVSERTSVVTAKQLKNSTSCGTTLCFAGQAAALFSADDVVFSSRSGAVVYVPQWDGEYVLNDRNAVVYDPNFVQTGRRYRGEDIEELARTLLALTYDQSQWLFASFRSVEELREGVRYLISNPVATYMELDSNCQDGTSW